MSEIKKKKKIYTQRLATHFLKFCSHTFAVRDGDPMFEISRRNTLLQSWGWANYFKASLSYL